MKNWVVIEKSRMPQSAIKAYAKEGGYLRTIERGKIKLRKLNEFSLLLDYLDKVYSDFVRLNEWRVSQALISQYDDLGKTTDGKWTIRLSCGMKVGTLSIKSVSQDEHMKALERLDKMFNVL